jgi:membrane-associated phospholipid phosphatase
MRPGPRLAAVVLMASIVTFAMLAWAALRADTLPQLDRDIAEWLRTHVGASMRHAMQRVSDLHAPRGILAMTGIVAAAWLWRRDVAGTVMLLATVLGGATLNHFLKHGFQRSRPGMDGVLSGTDFSFPSGHVANSTLLYGVVAVWLFARLPTRAARLAVVCGAAAIVCLVAASRMLLGAHYLSDVLAGALVGLAWLSLCFLVGTRFATGTSSSH